jgi:HD-GYP domain-containing protein (c-di-GMP phosphodiesterase class II)
MLRDVALAFARYADIKSPFRIGHSTGVAALAVRVATRARLPAERIEQLEIASLLHDLGIVSVMNGILDKPGPLERTERDRIEQHAYQTQRILAQTALLEPFAALAGAHHERLDGSGYPRSRAATALDVSSRILGACDFAHALREERAHRPAHGLPACTRLLDEEARAGRLDCEIVTWTLEALGAEVPSRAHVGPDGLSAREVEVLCHLARGRSNKEIGKRLFISARTVQQHVRHIYEKTGVTTRAAAALYATQHGLVGRIAD